MMYVLTQCILVYSRFVSGFIYLHTDKYSFIEVIDCRYNRHKIRVYVYAFSTFIAISSLFTNFKVMSIVKYTVPDICAVVC